VKIPLKRLNKNRQSYSDIVNIHGDLLTFSRFYGKIFFV